MERAAYEGDGDWQDGRLGQAYDLIYEVILDGGGMVRNHPLLADIEALDGELKENAA